MKAIRTLVVDDEVLGRNRIKNLLVSNDRIQVVGESRNGTEALEMISKYKPDLVFLDVEMPDKDGFQVLNSLPENERPFVIFVTAHDRFAKKAFDVRAVDFVHKPFDDERFSRAVTNAMQHIEFRDQSMLNNRLLRILDDFRHSNQSSPNIVRIRERGRERLINLYDVLYVEAEGNYLKLQLENSRHLVRFTMAQIDEQLDRACFLRIHRSLIVNVNYLKNRVYKGNNEYVFKMRNGTQLTSGRSYREAIEQYFTDT